MFHALRAIGSRAWEGVRDYFWDEDRAILSVLALLSVTGAFLYLGGTFQRLAPYAYYAAGRFQEIAQGPGDPVDTYSSLLGMKPAWGEVYYRRGLIFQKHRMADKALADFEMAAEFLKDPGKAFRAHGRLSAEQGMNDQALWDFKVAINKRPSDGKNFLARADVYMKMNKYTEALEDYKKALSLDAKLLDARIGVEEAKHAMEQSDLNKRLNTGE